MIPESTDRIADFNGSICTMKSLSGKAKQKLPELALLTNTEQVKTKAHHYKHIREHYNDLKEAMFHPPHLFDLCRKQMALRGSVDYYKFHQEVSSLENELFESTISNVTSLLGRINIPLDAYYLLVDLTNHFFLIIIVN